MYERRRHTDLSSGSNPIDLVIGIAAEYLIFSGRYCVTLLRRGSGPYTVYRILLVRVDGAAFQPRIRRVARSYDISRTECRRTETRYKVISVAND